MLVEVEAAGVIIATALAAQNLKGTKDEDRIPVNIGDEVIQGSP